MMEYGHVHLFCICQRMNLKKNVMQRMLCALKDDGVIYTSFKDGTFEGERNGRYFTDFTEKKHLMGF